MSAPVGVPIAAAPMDPGAGVAGPGAPRPPPPTAAPGGDKKRKAPPGGAGQPARKDRPGSMTEEDGAAASAAASNAQSAANSGTATPANAAAAGRPREAKRTRVHFSCVECHRRKQKCDRKEPCSQCVARRVPHLCRPFLNGVEDPNAYVSAGAWADPSPAPPHPPRAGAGDGECARAPGRRVDR